MLQYETVSIVYNRMVKLNVHWIDNPHVPIHSTVYRAVVYLLNKEYWNDQLCRSVFVPCIYSSQVVVLFRYCFHISTHSIQLNLMLLKYTV
jgi:hypothetical protein